MKLIIATHNTGKLKEIRTLLSGLPVDVLSAEEAGVHEDVVEDAPDFEGNALKKAKFVATKAHEWALADDTGLCIEALGGEPGVHSKRWAGDRADDHDLIAFTLEKIKNIPQEKLHAYFETAIVLCHPNGEHRTFVGRIDGTLVHRPRGESHSNLPYDQLFVPAGYTKTFAEMTHEEKNSISHRGVALAKAKQFLETQVLT